MSKTSGVCPAPPQDRPPVLADVVVERLTPDGALPVWRVDVDPAERWSTLVSMLDACTGWHPILLASESGDVGRHCAAFEPDHVPAPDDTDTSDVDEHAALARAGLDRVDPLVAEAITTSVLPPAADVELPGVLCLVPTPERSHQHADVFATMQWDGPVNVCTTAELTVLLRRWDRLFGAVPVAGDTEGSEVTLLIGRPPVDAPGWAAAHSELECCCDTITIIPAPSGAAPLVTLWWD